MPTTIEEFVEVLEDLPPEDRWKAFLYAMGSWARSSGAFDHPNWRGAETPSIVKTPGVCGGDARLVRTRIPVWAVVRMRQLGATDAELLAAYPTLTAYDLVQAWAYAETHKEEIDLS